MCLERNTAEPGLGCLITTMSTFIARILFTVSISVSPLLTDEEEAEKLITSADNLRSANSNDNRVRVEFSKNKLAMVTSRKEGTFLMGRFNTSLKLSAVENTRSMSSFVRPFIPKRWLTLKRDKIIVSC
jgi:hypothetical protein